MPEDLQSIACPIQRAATLVGDVTVIVIVRELRTGPRRFGQLLVPGLNPRSLSKRLQRLTQEGILERTRYAESPPRVEYCLTTKGQALLPVLEALQSFGAAWLPVGAPAHPHGPVSSRQPGILCPENELQGAPLSTPGRMIAEL